MSTLFLMTLALPVFGMLVGMTLGSVRYAEPEVEIHAGQALEERAFEEEAGGAPAELDVRIEIIPTEPLPPAEEAEAEETEGADEEDRGE